MTGTLFPDWIQKHNDDLPGLPDRIKVMLNKFGRFSPPQNCKDCRHLRRYQAGGKWMKCDLTKQTGGSGSDWKASWPACGKFEEGGIMKATWVKS